MMDVGLSYTHPTSAKSCLSQTASLVQWLVAIYSAPPLIDNAMVGCFLHFHKMTSTPTKNTYPVVDHWSCTSSTQSALQKNSQDNILASKA